MSQPTLGQSFVNSLNMHGFSLQHTIRRVVQDCFSQNLSDWRMEAVEFPVEVQGFGTRVDLILSHRNESVWLLGECKRANPALKDWCFAKYSWVHSGRSLEFLFADVITKGTSGGVRSSGMRLNAPDPPMHIGLEIKGNERGDSFGTGRGAIEEAVTQACRHMNGMIQFLDAHAFVMKSVRLIFLPLIFTSARIWRTDIELDEADLLTGNLKVTDTEMKEVPYVILQYPMSPGLKSETRLPPGFPLSLGGMLDFLYTRSVIIASTSQLEKFLGCAA